MSEEQAMDNGGDAVPPAESRQGVVIGILVCVLAALAAFFVVHAAG